jgi:hypothetical protein
MELLLKKSKRLAIKHLEIVKKELRSELNECVDFADSVLVELYETKIKEIDSSILSIKNTLSMYGN